MSSTVDYEDAVRAFEEVTERSRRLDARRTELLDQIAAARRGDLSPRIAGGTMYRVKVETPNVVDVSRGRRFTLKPGQLAAGTTLIARNDAHGVVVLGNDTIEKLISEGRMEAV
jgi:hypothetical protein